MKMLAKLGATLVPMALPPACKKFLPLNSKRSMSVEFFGTANGDLWSSSRARTAIIPSRFGMLVYKLLTSAVLRDVPAGSLPKLTSLFMKSVVFLMYDLSLVSRGCRKPI